MQSAPHFERLQANPDPNKKKGLLAEALLLEHDANRKIKRAPPNIPDTAATGATLLIGGA